MDTPDLPIHPLPEPIRASFGPDEDPYPSLKPSHQRFIDALLVNGGNQRQAWMAAGYTDNPERASNDASECLRTNPSVRRAYEIRKAQLAAQANISMDRIAAELATHALVDISPLYDPDTFRLRPVSQWPADLRRCVQEVTYISGTEVREKNGAIKRTPDHVKVKFVNRQTALELLGKYRGMFKDDKIVDQRQIVFNLSIEQDNRSLHINKDAVGGLILDADSTEEQQ